MKFSVLKHGFCMNAISASPMFIESVKNQEIRCGNTGTTASYVEATVILNDVRSIQSYLLKQ